MSGKVIFLQITANKLYRTPTIWSIHTQIYTHTHSCPVLLFSCRLSTPPHKGEPTRIDYLLQYSKCHPYTRTHTCAKVYRRRLGISPFQVFVVTLRTLTTFLILLLCVYCITILYRGQIHGCKLSTHSWQGEAFELFRFVTIKATPWVDGQTCAIFTMHSIYMYMYIQVNRKTVTSKVLVSVYLYIETKTTERIDKEHSIT